MKKVPVFLCTAALVAAMLPLSAMAAATSGGTQQLINAPIPCKGGAVLISSVYKSSDGTKEESLHSSLYTCDDAGRILSRLTYMADGTPATPAFYSYDEEGRLLACGSEAPTNDSQDWADLVYTYDAEGRLESSRASYDTAATTYGDYDENGNPHSSTVEDGSKITNSYDSDGNLKKRITEDGSVIYYTRDSYGNITEEKNEFNGTESASIQYTYTYDSFGNILTESTKDEAGVTYTTTYTYSYSDETSAESSTATSIETTTETSPETPTETPATVSVETPAVTSSVGPVVMLSPQNLTVDGKVITCDKYNIDNANYFKLRDIACLMMGTEYQFGVSYDAISNTVTLIKGGNYLTTGSELTVGDDKSATAVKSQQIIIIDGQRLTDISVYNIGGNNYFKLRDMGDAIGFGVDYDEATNTAIVTTTPVAAKTVETMEGAEPMESKDPTEPTESIGTTEPVQ